MTCRPASPTISSGSGVTAERTEGWRVCCGRYCCGSLEPETIQPHRRACRCCCAPSPVQTATLPGLRRCRRRRRPSASRARSGSCSACSSTATASVASASTSMPWSAPAAPSRDRLSTRCLARDQRPRSGARRPRDLGAASEALQRVIILLAAFAGSVRESMSRGQGWRFLEIGRYLERALHTVVAAARSVHRQRRHAAAHARDAARGRRTASRPIAAAIVRGCDAGARARSAAARREQSALAGYQLAAPRCAGRRTAAASGATRRGTAQRLSLDALTQLRLFDVATLAERRRRPERPARADGARARALLQRLGDTAAPRCPTS